MLFSQRSTTEAGVTAAAPPADTVPLGTGTSSGGCESAAVNTRIDKPLPTIEKNLQPDSDIRNLGGDAMPGQNRRQFIFNSLGFLMLPALPVVAAGMLSPTPSQTAGPFYPPDLPLDDDNDLTRVAGFDKPALGTIADLSGRLLDRNGNPLNGLRIEIWQCDANGRYHHPADSGRSPVDEGFQGHGHTHSDDRGRYRFRTIRPVHYPGRTPHIHVAVVPDTQNAFVTQLYVANEQRNAWDPLYRRIPVDQRHLVTAEFKAGADQSSRTLTANWDIVLGINAI